jgi:stringent starvation protein B
VDRQVEEKKERLLAALEQGMVMVHLDARRPGVIVPTSLKGESHLRLNVSYRFDPPDLSVNEWGLRCTLSFGGKRFLVAVPWSSLFAITSYVSKDFWMYPDDMPAELVQEALLTAKAVPPPGENKQKAILREVVLENAADNEPDDEPPKPKTRGHLRVVK